jgi:protein SCO1
MLNYRQVGRSSTPLLLVVALCALAGCGGQQGSPAQGQERRFALKGTVISVDKAAERLVVDHEAIEGFMAAMTMPYLVANASELDAVGPGDQITADVVVTDKGARLENIVVVKKAEAKPGGSLRQNGPRIAPPHSEFAALDGPQIPPHRRASLL